MVPEAPWSQDAQDLARALESPQSGLTLQQAALRLAETGANTLPPAKPRSMIARLGAQFTNPLYYLLLVAAAVTLILAHFVDAGVILAVVVINAVIGVVQEGRAEAAIAAIRQMLSPQARVRRDGHLQTIDAADLAPGDRVVLSRGDRVPADIRLTAATRLAIDEALLTGESIPSSKSVVPLPPGTLLADRKCMAHSGTLVTAGGGEGIVTSTGPASEIGRISTGLSKVETLATPLTLKLAQFAKQLSLIILVVAAIGFGVGVGFHGSDWQEMLMAAVGLAVAAIPEGLPAIMTIALAVGVQRMARQNAIIRRLPAVETLGSVTIICSDKTGTFTRNEMMVAHLVTADGEYAFSGQGYDPAGDVLPPRERSARSHAFEDAARLATLACDSEIEVDDSNRSAKVLGDPMEAAILIASLKAGQGDARTLHPRLACAPFDPEKRYMAVWAEAASTSSDTAPMIVVKGAPETVLEMCTAQASAEGGAFPLPIDRSYWLGSMQALADRGERVLALATRTLAPSEEIAPEETPHGLTLLGFVGLIDPPRTEAVEAVARCHGAGITVKMITGDHPATARAIARQLGIDEQHGALTGSDLDRLSTDDLADTAMRVNVFARAAPENKIALIQALQSKSHVVAMTGDGVNDAPALRRANVGIAMGRKGTEVAKEAADMVLADDNFASISKAVREGRVVYENLRKSILFILPTNAAEALILLAAMATGTLLPITAVQVLWVNMATAVTLALALAFEPAEHGVMQKHPRAPDEPLINGQLIWRLAIVGALGSAAAYGAFLWRLDQGASLDAARTLAVNTLVVVEIFYLFNSRFPKLPSLSWRALTANPWALAAAATALCLQLAFTYWPPMQFLFATEGMASMDWLIAFGAGLIVFLVVECEKAVVSRFTSRATEAHPEKG